jgi:hypothetical protein
MTAAQWTTSSTPSVARRDGGVRHVPETGFNSRHVDRPSIQRPNRHALSDKAVRNPATDEAGSSGDQGELPVSCHAEMIGSFDIRGR